MLKFYSGIFFVLLGINAVIIFVRLNQESQAQEREELKMISASLRQGYHPVPARTQNCGPKSLYSILSYLDPEIQYSEVKKQFERGDGGATVSFAELQDAAISFGFSTKAVKIDYQALKKWLNRKGHFAILHCKDRHFAPALSVSGNGIVLCDSAVGVDLVNAEQLQGNRYFWTGTTLLLELKK